MELLNHTFVINLDHRTDRLEHVTKEFEKMGINAERISGIQPKSPAIGCTMSHIKCLELAKTRNYKQVFISEDDITAGLTTMPLAEPDLFIRTGGEQRVSNFLLWQMAYTEFYFTDTLWPDFNEQSLDDAIFSFGQRERRFGRTSEQLKDDTNA